MRKLLRQSKGLALAATDQRRDLRGRLLKVSFQNCSQAGNFAGDKTRLCVARGIAPKVTNAPGPGRVANEETRQGVRRNRRACLARRADRETGRGSRQPSGRV